MLEIFFIKTFETLLYISIAFLVCYDKQVWKAKFLSFVTPDKAEIIPMQKEPC